MNRPSLASAICSGSAPPQPVNGRTLYVRALSAASETGLRAAARRTARQLTAATISTRPGAHRLVAIGESPVAVSSRLAAFGAGQTVEGIQIGRRPEAGTPPVVFVFTGLGSEYAGMGRRLFAQSRVFRHELELCDAVYRQVCGMPLLTPDDPPFGDGASLRCTAYVQPALFAFEYALAQVWRAAGVEPDAVIGYSLGEDVAACVAGTVSRDDLLEFVIARAHLMDRHEKDGRMAAIFADEGRVREALASHPGVAIAAVNGRENTVVSGPGPAVDALLAHLALQRIRGRRVQTRHAFHSPLMDPLVPEIERHASAVRFSPPQLRVLSTATGQWADQGDITDPRIWSRRVRDTVRFSDGLDRLYGEGYRVFVEIGPHPVCLSIAGRHLPEDIVRVPALRRDDDDIAVTAAGLSTLFVNGVEVRWRTLDRFVAHTPTMFPAAVMRPSSEASR